MSSAQKEDYNVDGFIDLKRGFMWMSGYIGVSVDVRWCENLNNKLAFVTSTQNGMHLQMVVDMNRKTVTDMATQCADLPPIHVPFEIVSTEL